MALKVQTYNKKCLQAEWSAVVPRVGVTSESPVVIFEGCNWTFKLMSKWSESANDEEWTMVFEKCSKVNMLSKFLLTAHVRTKEGYLCMTQVEIIHFETTIWKWTQRIFLSIYPQVEFTETNTLTFVFTLATFHFDVLNKNDCPKAHKEHKVVQTSSYLDCLKNLSQDLGKLMNDGSSPDVQLRCGDRTIPAHKHILGARSEVFRTMLRSDMQEGRQGSVDIVDMEPNVCEIFVRYLYTGILPHLTEDVASPLYEAADKYHVEALRRRCGDFLAENLTRENACLILAMADAHSDRDLKNTVVSYILNEKIPTDADEWPVFCKSHPNLALDVLNQAYQQSNVSLIKV